MLPSLIAVAKVLISIWLDEQSGACRNPLRAYVGGPLVFRVYGAGYNRGAARFYPAFQNEAPRAGGSALDVGPVGIAMPRKGDILALGCLQRREVGGKFSTSVARRFHVSVCASVTWNPLRTLASSWSGCSGNAQ